MAAMGMAIAPAHTFGEEAVSMAIYRLLQQSAFDPEDISRMTTAYKECLRVLKLVNGADPITELLAKHIIEVAQTGERDASRIRELTLERLRAGQ
jgi:hypothetical protein